MMGLGWRLRHPSVERLRAECCICDACGHVQAEPTWCHRCGQRTTWPEWAIRRDADVTGLREAIRRHQAELDEAALHGPSRDRDDVDNDLYQRVGAGR